MNHKPSIRTFITNFTTSADRRVVAVVGATVAVTALVGGLAFAASGPDPGARVEPERTASSTTTSDDLSPDIAAATRGDDSADEAPAGGTRRPGTTIRSNGSSTSIPSGRSTADAFEDDAIDDLGTPSTTTTDPPDGHSPSTTAPGASDEPSARPAPMTVAPTPDELEPEPGPGAGQVVALGGTTVKPTHPGPSKATLDLDLVEDAAPPPPPAVPPVPVPPFPSAGGGLVGNAFGCKSNCIVHAELQSFPFSPDLGFDLETRVDVTASIWVSENQPVIDEGRPVPQGWPQYLRPGWVREWQTTVELEYETTYWITLRVEDTQGNLKWAITDYSTGAPPTPDQLAAEGDGCYFQCIDFGKIEYTDSYDTVVMVIGTNVPYEDIVFDVAVSTNEPVWSNGKPTLAGQFPFVLDQDGGNDVRGHVNGLAPGTTYHVVVKAIDEDGFIAHATGNFTTDLEPPTDVRVTWERFFVHYDGDAGGWGRGEISWAWGMADWVGDPNWGTPYTTYAARSEEKIGDNTSIVLGPGNHHWVSVDAGAAIPDLAVNAHENDTHGNVSYDVCIRYRDVTLGWQHYQSNCMTRTNVAVAEGLTVADIAALPKCWEYDVPNERGEDRCLVIESLPANDQHVRFDALISFHIPT